MKYLLTAAFIGTAYCGWQAQKNGVSVQSTVQSAILSLFGQSGKVTGCSRTDSGVHARAFRFTAELDENAPEIPCRALPEALNRFLPPDVAVSEACIVPDSFHPRYCASGKEYEYLIYSSRSRSPFLEGRACRVCRPLDAEAMDSAARELEGRHDFSAFMASGSSVTDTVRTIFSCRVTEKDKGLISIRVYGDGFLYNMVRIISGTLLLAGEGKLSPEDMRGILLSRDRQTAGATLPACGLYLDRVVYNEYNVG